MAEESVLKDAQKQEAIRCMKILQLHENVINEFEKDGQLNVSEHYGALFWLSDKEKKIVEKVESRYNVLVYHLIKNFTTIGELFTCLCVSDDMTEWEEDRKYLKAGYAYAYIENITDPSLSEFGSVAIVPRYGGVVQIY